jgi:hypothetical protein
VLGTAAALLGVEPAVRVDLALEAGQERGPAVGAGPASVMAGVHGVGREARPQASLCRAQGRLWMGESRQDGWGTLFAHLRGPFLGCQAPGRSQLRRGHAFLGVLLEPHLLSAFTSMQKILVADEIFLAVVRILWTTD